MKPGVLALNFHEVSSNDPKSAALLSYDVF